MPIKFEFESPDKGVWVLLRQTYNLVLKCEDRVFGEYGLTTEQHVVLMACPWCGPPSVGMVA